MFVIKVKNLESSLFYIMFVVYDKTNASFNKFVVKKGRLHTFLPKNTFMQRLLLNEFTIYSP